jgi:predicted metal-binding transcription factor (methanogenesis marker protein 9)
MCCNLTFSEQITTQTNNEEYRTEASRIHTSEDVCVCVCVCVSVCCVRVCAPFHDDVLDTVTLSGKGYMPLKNSRLPARVGITYTLCV